MRKLLYLVFATLFAQDIAFAQEDIKTEMGIKGGINVSNFNGYGGYFANRPGVHAGLLISQVLFERASLRFEPAYSQKGVIMYFNVPGKGQLKVNSKLHYLDLPFLFDYRLIKDLHIYAGPQLNILLAKKAKVKNSEGTATIVGPSKFEFGVTGGVSYKLFDRLYLDARYSRGLASIISTGNQRNALFQAGLIYSICRK